MQNIINVKNITALQGVAIPGLEYYASILNGGGASGYSVQSLDLNCNGHADIAIADSFAHSPVDGVPGIVSIILDRVNLSGIANLTSSIQITADPLYSEIGSSLGVLKNFNGNCDAILIGASNAGVVYLCPGKPNFQNIDLANYQAASCVRFLGNYADTVGFSVASAGHFYGTSNQDVIISAPGNRDENGNAVGTVYIVKGDFIKDAIQNSQLDIDLRNLDPAISGVKIQGPVMSSDYTFGLGASVAGDFDFNGDKYSDVVACNPNWKDLQGICSVIFGGVSHRNLNLTSFSGNSNEYLNIIGPAGYAHQAGYSVAPAIGFNSKIYDSLIIGAPQGPATFIIYGSSNTQDISIDPHQNDLGVTIRNSADSSCAFMGFGSAVASNNENGGYIAIADFCSRKTHVIFGKSSLQQNLDLSAANSYQGIEIDNIDFCDGGGCAPLAVVQNFDGQNRSDLIIGASNTKGTQGYSDGESYLIFVNENLNITTGAPALAPNLYPSMPSSSSTAYLHPATDTTQTPTPMHHSQDSSSWSALDTIILSVGISIFVVIGLAVGYCCCTQTKISSTYMPLDEMG